MSHDDATTSVMMQVPGVGAFVRVLLPVALVGGVTLTFGVWLGVDPSTLQYIVREWRVSTYPNLVLDGRVANDVKPWGLLAKPGRAVVRDPEQTPYLDSSTDDQLQRVLSHEWPHDDVMDALPEGLR